MDTVTMNLLSKYDPHWIKQQNNILFEPTRETPIPEAWKIDIDPKLLMEKVQQLVMLGCNVKYCDLGILVNDRYIVAPYRRYWMIDGEFKRRYYKSISHLVEKVINK